MARVFARLHKQDPNIVIFSDQLPDAKGEFHASTAAICRSFCVEAGINMTTLDQKGKEVVEYEITVKEVARYGLVIESPWKKK